jgi:hypothetical protein
MRLEHCRRVAGALEQCSRNHKTSVTLFAAQLSATRACPADRRLELLGTPAVACSQEKRAPRWADLTGHDEGMHL